MRRCSPVRRAACVAVFFVCLTLTVSAQQGGWRQQWQKGREAFNAMKAQECVTHLTRALKEMPGLPENMAVRFEMHKMRAAANELRGHPLEALNDARTALALRQRLDKNMEQLSWVRPLLQVARCQELTRDRREAVKSYLEALRLAREKEGSQELLQEILHRCARAQRLSGDWKGALTSLNTCIELIQKRLGETHADLVGPLKDKALCQRNLKDHRGAVATMRQWVRVYEEARGKGDPSTATGLRSIAESLVALQDSAAAMAACDRWQEVLEKVTPKHPEMVRLLTLRARVSRQQKKYPQEVTFLQEAVQRLKALPRPDQVQLGSLLQELARAQKDCGRLKDAESSIGHACAIFKEKLRSDDPQRIRAREERGLIRLKLGDRAGAKSDLQATLRAWNKLADDRHPALRPALEGLLKLAQASGNKEEIKKIQTQLSRLRKP